MAGGDAHLSSSTGSGIGVASVDVVSSESIYEPWVVSVGISSLEAKLGALILTSDKDTIELATLQDLRELGPVLDVVVVCGPGGGGRGRRRGRGAPSETACR